MWILSPSCSSRRAALANNRNTGIFQRAPITSSSDPQCAGVKCSSVTSRLQYINGTATPREKIPNGRASILRTFATAVLETEGNLCLAATGSVNEDVIETAICDGNDKYQAWQLKVIEELPQHLDDEYGGH